MAFPRILKLPSRNRLVRPSAVWTLAVTLALLCSGPAHARRSRQDPSVRQIYSAHVPSLCGHDGGDLVDGKLPGIPVDRGFVELASLLGMRHQIAGGRLSGYRGRVIAAGVECKQGGVPWPEYLEVYGRDARRIGGMDLGKLLPGEETSINRVVVRDGSISVEAIGGQRRDDPDCCGSVSELLKLQYDGGRRRLAVVARRKYTERDSLARLLTLVSRRASGAERYATAGVVRFLESLPSRRFSVGRCYGTLSPWWMASTPSAYTRACNVVVHERSGPVLVTVDMQRVTWNRWRAGRIDSGD